MIGAPPANENHPQIQTKGWENGYHTGLVRGPRVPSSHNTQKEREKAVHPHNIHSYI